MLKKIGEGLAGILIIAVILAIFGGALFVAWWLLRLAYYRFTSI